MTVRLRHIIPTMLGVLCVLAGPALSIRNHEPDRRPHDETDQLFDRQSSRSTGDERPHEDSTITVLRLMIDSLTALDERYTASSDFENAYRYRRQRSTLRDSLLIYVNAQQVRTLKEQYDLDWQQKQIALRTQDRRIDSLELVRREAALAQAELARIAQRQRIVLLEQERDIRHLELARQSSRLALTASTLAIHKEESAQKQREAAVQSAKLDKTMTARNAASAAALLLTLTAGLVIRNLRQKQRTAALVAETAEHRAAVTEAETFRMRTEHDRRETDLRRAFSGRLLEAQEQERRRITSTLLDGVCRQLNDIGIRAHAVEGSGPESHGLLRIIHHGATDALENVRRISRELRPSQIERVGISASLRSMLEQVEETNSLQWRVDVDDIDGLIPREKDISLYRVVEEGVRNVLLHAEAREAVVLVKRHEASIIVTIRDDGRGFDTAPFHAGTERSGIGLRGISERVRILGGEFTIDSAPGRGTVLRASIPTGASETTAGDNIATAADERSHEH